jgi:hypothetical protein
VSRAAADTVARPPSSPDNRIVVGTERQRELAAHAIRAIARIVLVLLLVRVVVLFFAPSPDDQRVTWLLVATQPLEDPYRVVIHTVFMDPFSGSILDTVALAAMIGYALLEAGLVRALAWQPTIREPLPPIPSDLIAAAPPPRSMQPRRPTGPPAIEPVPTVRVSGETHRPRHN